GFTGRGNFELKVTIPAGSSKVEPRTATQPGVPAKPITLSWTNFRYAAEQAGLSRQYGGGPFQHGDKDAPAPRPNGGRRPGRLPCLGPTSGMRPSRPGCHASTAGSISSTATRTPAPPAPRWAT